MTRLKDELDRLLSEIGQADEGEAYRFHAPLRDVLEKMEAQGENIPATAKNTLEELLSEAIEAQFDNMPV